MWLIFIKYALIPFLVFCAALAVYEWIDSKLLNGGKKK